MNKLMARFLAVLLLAQPATVLAWDIKNLNVDKTISAGAKVTKAVMGISEEDEIAIGKTVADSMTAKFGVVDNPKLLAYVDSVGQALAKKSSRPNLTYHFAILKSADVNAFAAPGGYIFVTQGILNFVKDEAELAGVLGHEINHVTQRHVVKAMQKSNLLAGAADFADAHSKNPYLQEQLSKFATDLLLKGLSRQDELEADQLAAVLVTKEGYTPLGMKDTMSRLGQAEGKSSIVKHLTQTHPPAKDRVKAITDTIHKKNLKTTGQRQKIRFNAEMEGARA